MGFHKELSVKSDSRTRAGCPGVFRRIWRRQPRLHLDGERGPLAGRDIVKTVSMLRGIRRPHPRLDAIEGCIRRAPGDKGRVGVGENRPLMANDDRHAACFGVEDCLMRTEGAMNYRISQTGFVKRDGTFEWGPVNDPALR